MSLLSTKASARGPVLQGQRSLQAFGEFPEFLRDPEGRLTFADVQAMNLPTHTDRNPSFGWTQNAIWLSTEYEKRDSEPYILQIAYPLLDRVDLMILRDGVPVTSLVFGDSVKQSPEILDTVDPAFTLPLAPGQYRLILRIVSTSSVQAPMHVYGPRVFEERTREELFINGAYTGIFVITIFYNFFVFLSTRSLSYFYYTAYVAMFLMFQLSLDGYTQHYLWPEDSRWTDWMICQGGFLTEISVILFADHFLKVQQHGRKRGLALRLILTLMGLGFLASWFLPYFVAVKVMTILAGVGIFFLIFVSVLKAIEGRREAWFYLSAWCLFILGVLCLIGKQLGLLPVTTLTVYSLKLGSVFEIAILSFALADQLNILRKQLSLALEDQIAHARLQEKITHERERHERNLRFQSEQRLNLASAVAHRINNPLNYISLGRSDIEVHLDKLQLLVGSLLGESPSSDPEVAAVQQRFAEITGGLASGLNLIHSGVEKVSTTVKEVKILSGVERIALEMLRIDAIWNMSLERLREIFEPQQYARIEVQWQDGVEEESLICNRFVLKSALEILVVTLLPKTKGTLSLVNGKSADVPWTLSCDVDLNADPALLEALQFNLNNLLNLAQLQCECALSGEKTLVRISQVKKSIQILTSDSLEQAA